MDLRQLRYFAEIVEAGSLSKAAANLHVAQPALSQHVRHMEEELSVALLHRGTHGVVPTEAGQRLYISARRILAEFAELPDSVRGEAVAPRGEVRFGMPATVGEQLAVPLIEAAKARYPDIRIRVVEAMSGYVLDWLKRGEVDLAIIYGTSDPRGLAVHHALSEEICLFAIRRMEAPKQLSEGNGALTPTPSRPSGDPPLPHKVGERKGAKLAAGSSSPPSSGGEVAREARRSGGRPAHIPAMSGDSICLRDAAALPLIVPGPGHGLRDLIEAAALSAGVSIAPAVEIDSYSQIKRLVLRGLGYGILPLTAIQAEADAFHIWRFTDPPLTRKVHLAYSTERPLLNAPRAVGQLAWEVLRQLVRDSAWAVELTGDDNAPALWS